MMITFFNHKSLVKTAKLAVIIVGVLVLPVYFYIDMNSKNGIDATVYFFFISVLIVIIGMTLFSERLGRLSIIIAIILSIIWFVALVLGNYQII